MHPDVKHFFLEKLTSAVDSYSVLVLLVSVELVTELHFSLTPSRVVRFELDLLQLVSAVNAGQHDDHTEEKDTHIFHMSLALYNSTSLIQR